MSLNTPPPYSNISGINKAIDNHANCSITEYDGNARPGELVVDLDTFSLYVGNDSGNLLLLSSGGGGGHAGGNTGEVQFNSAGNLAGSTHFTYDDTTNKLTLGGLLDLSELAVTTVSTSIIPSSNVALSLGNATNQWRDLWVSNNTIYLNSIPISLTANNDLTVAGNSVVTTSGNGSTNVTSLTVSGAIGAQTANVTGNITTANFFVGDGGFISNINAGNISGLYSNTNATALLANLGANTISSTGAIIAAYFTGDGANLTGLPASYSNTNTAAYLASGTITSNITTTATVTGASVLANVIAAASTNMVLDPGADGLQTTGNVQILGNLSVTGNLTYVDVSTAVTSNLVWAAAAAANTAAAATGGGLTVGNVTAPFARLIYSGANSSWMSNVAITVANTLAVKGGLTDSITSAAAGGLNLGTTATPATITLTNGGNPTTKFTVTTDTTAGVVNSGAVWVQGGLSVWRSVNIGGNANITGNIAASYLYGNGAFLTGLAATYSNTDAANYFASNANTAITVQGNITGDYILGNGALLTGLVAGYANTDAAGFLANLGSNAISTTGSVTAGYFVGDGANLTGLPAGYGNANLANIGANIISTTGNISAGYFIGNGSALTGMFGNANLANIGANSVSTTGSVTAGYFVGDGANLTGLPAGYSNANTAAFLANLNSNSIVTTGNITAGYFIGNGAALTTITATNVTGIVANANYAAFTGNAIRANTANTVIDSAQPNITTVGTLSSLSVSGMATISNITGEGGNLSNITAANITGIVANANYAAFSGNAIRANTANTVVDAAQPNITTVGTLTALAVSTNISSNNISVANNVTVGGNLSVTGNINLSGNVTQITGNSGQFFGDANGFGALYAGVTSYTSIPQTVIQMSANYDDFAEINIENTNSGPNASADYVATADIGDNSTYYADFGISSSTWDGQSANSIGNVIGALDTYLYAQGGGNATAPGGNLVVAVPTPGRTLKIAVGGGTTDDIIAQVSNTGVTVTGTVTATYLAGDGGNITGLPPAFGNADLANLGANAVSTSGNITGAYFIGNGVALTGINYANVVGTYGNSNVAANLAAFGNNSISTTGSITAGYFVGDGGNLSNVPVASIIANSTSNVSIPAANGAILFTVANTAVGNLSTNTVVLGATAMTGQGANSVAIGVGAGNSTQGANNVAVGRLAGSAGQSGGGVAIGNTAGQTSQGAGAVAIGNSAAQTTQGGYAVAIGHNAAANTQGAQAVAIGFNSGGTQGSGGVAIGAATGAGQGAQSVAVGAAAGGSSQNIQAVAIGYQASQFSQGANAVGIGFGAGYNAQGGNSVAIGINAGRGVQGASSVAIGASAGNVSQSANAIAIGTNAGSNTQGTNTVAIGTNSGVNGQGTNGIAIGTNTGVTNQGGQSVAVGSLAGQTNQGGQSVAVGYQAATSGQGGSAVAIGWGAGGTNQGGAGVAIGQNAGAGQGTNTVAIGIGAAGAGQSTQAVAIGYNSAQTSQGTAAVAIGYLAGGAQGIQSVAIGSAAGRSLQGTQAVAIGYLSANSNQGVRSVAIGYGTANAQGNGAIAIGANSVADLQTANSVVINASGNAITANNSGFYAAPVRNDVGNVTNVVYFNTATNELTYASASVVPDITSNSLSGPSTSQAITMYNYKDKVFPLTYAATLTPDPYNGSIQTVTLTGNVILNNFGGTPQAGQSMVIKMVQDATGNRIMTSSMLWAGGTKVLSTAPNAIDLVSVWFDGTTYFASLSRGYQ